MPAEIAGGLEAVALFAVPGFGLTELLPSLREKPLARRAAYGYLLGVATVSGSLYALSHACGVPLRPPAIFTVAIAPALAGLTAAVVRRMRARRSRPGPALPPAAIAAAPCDPSVETSRDRPFAPNHSLRGVPASPRRPERDEPPPPDRDSQSGLDPESRHWLGCDSGHPTQAAGQHGLHRRRRPEQRHRRLRQAGGLLAAACAVLATVICAAVFAEAVSDPVNDWDGRMTWGTAARYVRAAGSVDAAALREERWYVTHPQYPLLLPIAQTAVLEAAGADPDAPRMRALYAACLPALLLVIYDGARRGAGRTAAALAAVAIGLVPYVLLGGGGAATTYGDLPLAAFYGAALALLLAGRPRADGGLAAGLLLAGAALAKNEGTPLALLALALGWRALRRPAAGARGVWRFAAAALPVALALALLNSWRAGIVNRFDEAYPALLRATHLWPAVVTRAAALGPLLLDRMLRSGHWGAFWWMAPGVLLAGHRALRHPRNLRLLAAAAGPPALAWMAYAVHPRPAFIAAVTWDRILLQGAAPLAMVLAAAIGAAVRGGRQAPRAGG